MREQLGLSAESVAPYAAVFSLSLSNRQALTKLFCPAVALLLLAAAERCPTLGKSPALGNRWQNFACVVRRIKLRREGSNAALQVRMGARSLLKSRLSPAGADSAFGGHMLACAFI